MDISALFHDTNFFVLISCVVFGVVAYKKGRAPLFAFLDARSARIKADLDEAARLRIEAQNLLADIQQKHRDAVSMSEQIIRAARDTATRLQTETEAKLQETQKRREAQLLERIARAEAAAVDDIRNKAADLAAQSAEAILAEALAKRGGKIIDETIADLGQKLN